MGDPIIEYLKNRKINRKREEIEHLKHDIEIANKRHRMKGDLNIDFIMAVIVFISVYALLYTLIH